MNLQNLTEDQINPVYVIGVKKNKENMKKKVFYLSYF